MESQRVKKLPLRKCVVCSAMKEKKELLRLSDRKSAGIEFEPCSLCGKGVYICLSRGCLQAFLREKKFRVRFLARINDGYLKNLNDFIDKV